MSVSAYIAAEMQQRNRTTSETTTEKRRLSILKTGSTEKEKNKRDLVRNFRPGLDCDGMWRKGFSAAVPLNGVPVYMYA